MFIRLFENLINKLYFLRFAVTSPITYKYYRFYKTTQFWSGEKIQSYQFLKIKTILNYAYDNHEFYRELFDENGVHPRDYKTLDDITKFPVVTKDQLKEGLSKNKFKMPKKVVWHSTSGSSGEPFTFPVDQNAERLRKACKLRTEEWYGKKLGTKWLRLWRSGPRGLKENLLDYVLARKIEISFYRLDRPEENRLDDKKLQFFVDSINNSGSSIIEGYVSALSLIADYAIRTNQKFSTITTVVTGAEYLSSHARKQISDGFGAKVFNRYGGTEIGLIAHDDSEGEFKSMSDRLYFEAMCAKNTAGASELLITDFTNLAMPFIRYRVGDLIEQGEGEKTISVDEANLPNMATVQGRVNDFFTLPDGSLLTSHIWHVFFRDKLVRKFQVIQKKDKNILVKIVKEGGLDTKLLLVQLGNIVPDLEVELMVVEDISHSANGKFRHTVTDFEEHINNISGELIPPARNVSSIAAYIPVSDDDIDCHTSLKLDWNESTLESSDRVREALKAAIDRPNFLNWYPPLGKENVKNKLGEYLEIDAENIELFPGSDSAIDFICKVFLSKNDVVGLVEPTYDQARLTFEVHGAILKRYKFDNIISPSCKELLSQITGDEKMVYLSSPNNPVGHIWKKGDIRGLLSKYPTVLFVVDEAYMDFCQHESSIPLVMEYTNIIITRTFSKALGLASLRLGYIVYPVHYTNTFSKVVNVKDVNSLSLVAALAMFDDINQLKHQIEILNQGRDYLVKNLDELGYYTINGFGNFILVKLNDPERFVEYLASNKIYVRDRSKYPGLEGFVRITAGAEDQMKRLIQVVMCYEK